jgi:hypothetical protein
LSTRIDLRSGLWLALMLVGLAIVVTWCIILAPALTYAEAGAGLTLADMAFVSWPLALGSVMALVGRRGWKAARKKKKAAD